MRHLFKGMEEFLALGQTLSFRRAAELLGVTPAAVGMSLKALESRIGVQLFHRTTRRMEFTPAGKLLFDRCFPATREVKAAFAELEALGETPSGLLRICTHELALDVVVHAALPGFLAAHPAIAVDVEVREGVVDLVKEGYDVGIRMGEYVEPDMVAVVVGRPVHWVVAGARAYLDACGRPETLDALLQHRCVRRRWPQTDVHYRWQFVRRGRIVAIDPPSGTTVSGLASVSALVASGCGLGYIPRAMFEEIAKENEVEIVLGDLMPPPDLFFAYYSPATRGIRKVHAFVDAVKLFA